MIYCINGKLFNCVFDAIEYRDILDANYIKVVWKGMKTNNVYE